MKKTKKNYPEKKKRELTEKEKEKIRKRISDGDDNSFELGEEFGYSPSQIAGIKSDITKKGDKK